MKTNGKIHRPAGVMIVGSRGYLGQRFLQAYPDAATPSLDIADRALVRRALAEHQPGVVINCAGRCGSPNVDWCEDHKLETVHSNVTGALVLAEECLRHDVYLVHLSSGCVYSGDNGGKGYSEADPPNFAGSYYSRTKAAADQILREFPVLSLRLRMPFDDSLSPRNLLMKLRKYRRLLTAANSLTCVTDLVRAADRLIDQRYTGIVNVVNPGAISPFEVMEMYREIVDPGLQFEPIGVEQLGELTRAGRSTCILNTALLENVGIFLPLVRDALELTLRSLAAKLAGSGVAV
jgi:dTDP-4-dehydrorhamnose reductase